MIAVTERSEPSPGAGRDAAGVRRGDWAGRADLAPDWLTQFAALVRRRRRGRRAGRAERDGGRHRRRRTAGPAPAPSCSRASTSADSSSSPTTPRARRRELAANPARQPGVPVAPDRAAGGRHRPGASGSTGPRPRPTSPPGRARPSSAPGPARSPRWCADREALDRALAEAARRASPDEPIPAPPHWGGLRVDAGRRSSSGRAGPAGCTTGCATARTDSVAAGASARAARLRDRRVRDRT